jgi:ribonuclease P protein component
VAVAQLFGHVVLGAVRDSLFKTTNKFTVAYRLLRADSFDHVMGAKNFSDNRLKIFVLNNAKGNARLGIVASKKIFPRAVDRNLVKRIIRETFRQHTIKLCKLDIVVMVKHDHFLKDDARNVNLERLFSQIENRCAA